MATMRALYLCGASPCGPCPLPCVMSTTLRTRGSSPIPRVTHILLFSVFGPTWVQLRLRTVLRMLDAPSTARASLCGARGHHPEST
ncbi:hypothetical protein BD311DRAFT_256944 [Dichomitus squalens]|uniref:Uncharacterized protein n=1 Tax=Dichomitus squalens TaxID=114155 RepID=A0A4Q9MQ48_9APHY|nr:hypothetical protein BD311DRAFT_256944 [Dichomitus squalens]